MNATDAQGHYTRARKRQAAIDELFGDMVWTASRLAAESDDPHANEAVALFSLGTMMIDAGMRAVGRSMGKNADERPELIDQVRDRVVSGVNTWPPDLRPMPATVAPFSDEGVTISPTFAAALDEALTPAAFSPACKEGGSHCGQEGRTLDA